MNNSTNVLAAATVPLPDGKYPKQLKKIVRIFFSSSKIDRFDKNKAFA